MSPLASKLPSNQLECTIHTIRNDCNYVCFYIVVSTVFLFKFLVFSNISHVPCKTIMSDRNKDVVLKINKLNLELRKKLEVVSKWRVECAQLQLEFLKLYTPECLEIFESFKQVTEKDSHGKSSA